MKTLTAIVAIALFIVLPILFGWITRLIFFAIVVGGDPPPMEDNKPLKNAVILWACGIGGFLALSYLTNLWNHLPLR